MEKVRYERGWGAIAMPPALWIRETASTSEQNIGTSSSIHSARRCPDRVVTSAPGMTETGLARRAASSRSAIVAHSCCSSSSSRRFVPHRPKHRPLLGMLFDVPLQDRGELTDTGADVGLTVAGRREHERLFNPRVEKTVLAPRERGDQRRAGAKC